MASINQQGNYMVQYDLNRLQTNAGRMQRAMPSSAPLPEWAKSKLTQARSHVANVANYQQSKLGITSSDAKFAAVEVLKYAGILLGGAVVMGIPAYYLTAGAVDKKKDPETFSEYMAALTLFPITTAMWWAGGTSVLVGAKNNNGQQTGVGAALMAAAVMSRTSIPEVFRINRD